MANPILEEIDKLGSTWSDYREVNDDRLEKLEKGDITRAKELEVQLLKMDDDITDAIRGRKDAEAESEKMKGRVEMLEALSDRPKGSPQEQYDAKYTQLFVEGMRSSFTDQEVTGKMQRLASDNLERKDVITGTNIAGGFALPKVITGAVDSLILAQSDIVSEVKNVTVGSTDYQELISIHGGTSGWVAETGSRSATNTTNLRNCKPTWGELYAYPQISEWSAQDLLFNVEEWLINDIADGMGLALSTAIHSGNGTSKPTGMVNTTPVLTDDYASPLRNQAAYEFIVESTAASPVVFTLDSMIDLVYTLRPGYRMGAKFAMNSTTQGIIRKKKDSNGQYLWEPSLQLDQPDRLIGYPVFTWEDMADAGTIDAFSVAFGNFNRAYVLASRSEMMITPDQVTNPGYIRFYVRKRFGGIPLNNDAVKFYREAD